MHPFRLQRCLLRQQQKTFADGQSVFDKEEALVEAMARSPILSTLLIVAAMALVVRVAFTPSQPQETFVVGSTALRGVARAVGTSFTGAQLTPLDVSVRAIRIRIR